MYRTGSGGGAGSGAAVPPWVAAPPRTGGLLRHPCVALAARHLLRQLLYALHALHSRLPRAAGAAAAHALARLHAAAAAPLRLLGGGHSIRRRGTGGDGGGGGALGGDCDGSGGALGAGHAFDGGEPRRKEARAQAGTSAAIAVPLEVLRVRAFFSRGRGGAEEGKEGLHGAQRAHS